MWCNYRQNTFSVILSSSVTCKAIFDWNIKIPLVVCIAILFRSQFCFLVDSTRRAYRFLFRSQCFLLAVVDSRHIVSFLISYLLSRSISGRYSTAIVLPSLLCRCKIPSVPAVSKVLQPAFLRSCTPYRKRYDCLMAPRSDRKVCDTPSCGSAHSYRFCVSYCVQKNVCCHSENGVSARNNKAEGVNADERKRVERLPLSGVRVFSFFIAKATGW